MSPADAVREIGRRAKEGETQYSRDEALYVLREVSRNPNIPASRRKLAAQLFVDAGGRP